MGPGGRRGGCSARTKSLSIRSSIRALCAARVLFARSMISRTVAASLAGPVPPRLRAATL